MCGNSICQDRRFLARWMPALEDYFHYRNLDVSTLKELCRRWKPELMKGIPKEGKHEALADVYESIQELRYYREHFIRGVSASRLGQRAAVPRQPLDSRPGALARRSRTNSRIDAPVVVEPGAVPVAVVRALDHVQLLRLRRGREQLLAHRRRHVPVGGAVHEQHRCSQHFRSRERVELLRDQEVQRRVALRDEIGDDVKPASAMTPAALSTLAPSSSATAAPSEWP